MKKSSDTIYTAEDLLLQKIEEDSFVRSIAYAKTPVSELNRILELSNDKYLFERLYARFKIEKLRRSNKKRRSSIQTLCHNGNLSNDLKIQLEATFKKYHKRMLQQILLEENYNSQYSVLYLGSEAEFNSILELMNKSFPEMVFEQANDVELQQKNECDSYTPNITYDSLNIDNVYEQIEAIEHFVHSCPPDKENGKYSKRRCRNIMHKMLNNGLIPNLAIGQRGAEYIAWIPEIDIIGSSEKSNVDAIDNLGRKLIVAIGRQGLKSFVNTSGQYSSVLFGEDTTYMTSEEKYNAIMEVVLEATSQGTYFTAGNCTNVIKRLYALNLVNSPVEYYSQNGSYIAKIPGINLEGITNSSGSVTHRQNAANKNLIKEMVFNHERGTLIDLIDSTLLSGPIEAINEDWLLSRDYEPEEENNKEIINEIVQSSTKNEIKTTTTNSRINSSVNLSKLDFSFEEKDDDDGFNF